MFTNGFVLCSLHKQQTFYYVLIAMLKVMPSNMTRCMQDYADLIQTHRKSNADITIATHAVGLGQASFRGCCKVEDSGQT